MMKVLRFIALTLALTSLNNFGRKISFISQLRKPGCQDGPHNHRLQLLDKIAELDVVIAR